MWFFGGHKLKSGVLPTKYPLKKALVSTDEDS